MRSLLFFFIMFLILNSCKDESTKSNSDDLEKIAALHGELEQLKMDSKLKEDLINESLAFFDEIEDNLEIIHLKKNEPPSRHSLTRHIRFTRSQVTPL